MNKMSFSDAILAGDNRPQCTGKYYTTINGVIHSCLVGGAAEAVTGQITHDAATIIKSIAEACDVDTHLQIPMPPHPTLRGIPEKMFIFPALYTLSDDYGWTREQAANYIQQFEATHG